MTQLSFPFRVWLLLTFVCPPAAVLADESDKEAKKLERLGAQIQRNDAGDVVSFDWSDKEPGDPFDTPPPRMTEAHVKQLVHFSGLTRLQLRGMPITDDSVPYIVALQELRQLDIGKTKISAAGVKEIASRKSKLTHLSLEGLPIGDQSMRDVAQLDELRHLNLLSTRVGLAGIRHLAPLRHVERLDWNMMSDDEVAHLKDVIEIPWFLPAMSRGTLTYFDEGPKLTWIGFHTNAITDGALKHLHGLNDLERLNLMDTRVTGHGLSQLKELPKLRVLDVSSSAVEDAELASLGDLQQVRNLRLGYTDITDDAMRHVARMQRLETLDIEHTNVGDTGLLLLADAPALKKVNVKGTKVTRQGVARLSAARVDLAVVGETSSYLKERTGPVEFVNTPLPDVLTYLRDLHQVSFRIDEDAFAPAEVEKLLHSVRISLNSKGPAIWSQLHLMLRDTDLAFEVREGDVVITKRGAAGESVDTAWRDLTEARIFTELRNPTQWSFERQPLSEAILYIEDLHDFDIYWDAKHIRQTRISEDVSVTSTVQWKTSSLYDSLTELLKPLKLAIVVRHGALFVTTPEALVEAGDRVTVGVDRAELHRDGAGGVELARGTELIVMARNGEWVEVMALQGVKRHHGKIRRDKVVPCGHNRIGVPR